MAAVGYDVSNHPAYHHVGEEDEEAVEGQHRSLEDEDTNYTMFDLTIDSVDVTLSLWRWLDGKGLIEDAVVKGVRGQIGASRLPLVLHYRRLTICRPKKRLVRPQQSTRPSHV